MLPVLQLLGDASVSSCLFSPDDNFAFSALTLLLGISKSIRPVKKLSDDMLAWLSVWNKVQMIFMWSS